MLKKKKYVLHTHRHSESYTEKNLFEYTQLLVVVVVVTVLNGVASGTGKGTGKVTIGTGYRYRTPRLPDNFYAQYVFELQVFVCVCLGVRVYV